MITSYAASGGESTLDGIEPLWQKGTETLDIPFYFSVPIRALFNWYKNVCQRTSKKRVLKSSPRKAFSLSVGSCSNTTQTP